MTDKGEVIKAPEVENPTCIISGFILPDGRVFVEKVEPIETE